ncbi:MAG: acetyl-CoA acetyltransferase [Chloroflexi bacterium]|nr:acetyl-CoA acetyltransferase [Chloroflexota bacterium]
MESMKDKVAIVGAGCTKFGELYDQDYDDTVVDAAYQAFADAGVEPKDIQAGWVGCTSAGTGMLISSPLQLQYIPATHVENACASAYEAVRNAAFALVAKAYDLVLAVGVDKLSEGRMGGGEGGFRVGGVAGGGQMSDHPVYGAGTSATGRYALAATRYFHRYGLSREEGKRMLAMVSVNSHHNGARNPRAMFRNEITVEQVMNAPIIAWPLGLFDACGNADGAAAVVMCRTEDAKSFRSDYITIKGIEVSSGPGSGKHDPRYDYTVWNETVHASKAVYSYAGIKNPRKELDMVEVHDCFSIAHVIATESLGICGFGEAKKDIDSGAWWQDGEIPINLSGGLKAVGHPMGASGIREIHEIYKQIQGKAEEPSRQLKNVQMGLCHNQGGHPGRFNCAVCVIGVP